MRNTFVETLMELAAEDSNIFLLCGDLGFSVLEKFAVRFPDRFLNAGVSEQNMTGVAAGLALSGKTVFTYSIANFPVMRCLEQIRNDVCYHRANVKIVAVGGGLAYGPQGYTHHGVEDIGVMSLLPGLTVAVPADPVETRLITRLISKTPGPFYLRLGKAKEPVIHQKEPAVSIGKAIQLRAGSDLAIFSMGPITGSVLQAAEILATESIQARVLSMPWLEDGDAFGEAIEETACVLSVEEHGAGGLGSRLSHFVARQEKRCLFRDLIVKGPPADFAGSQEYLRERAGLGVKEIAQTARELFHRKQSSRHG
jgi:transketolase